LGLIYVRDVMRSWTLVLGCVISGVLLFVCGWLMPAHLRAVDVIVIENAGRHTHSVVASGLALVNTRHLGAAELLARAAHAQQLPAWSSLDAGVADLATAHPEWRVLGGTDPLMDALFPAGRDRGNEGSVPFTDFVLRRYNQDKALTYLDASSAPAVQALMRCRDLTNTVIFAPSHSSAGEAFDAALTVCGLLLDDGRLTPGLSNEVSRLAAGANRGGDSQPLEQALLDLMSLGQRFNWDQLTVFVENIDDTETLNQLANAFRLAHGSEPVIFSAVELSGRPDGVAGYLSHFSETGVSDVAASLRTGSGGVNELLRSDERLYDPGLRRTVAGWGPFAFFRDVAAEYCWRMPTVALTLKWLLYVAAGFLLAASLHFAQPDAPELERPLQVRGVHLAREFLFALGFLLVVLILSEPFLAVEGQKAVMPFRLRLPMAGGGVQAGINGAHESIMNPSNIWTMLLFFVLQALLYMSSLIKLAEIRRQRVPPRMKLKLLENEDHLFDAGLYLGFLGTIVSFILFSLNVVHQFSLMVAYSSTSFGIIFVSVFKICHLRGARRQLLLEAEKAQPEAAPVERSYATSP
jgi:hypothetical protein